MIHFSLCTVSIDTVTERLTLNWEITTLGNKSTCTFQMLQHGNAMAIFCILSHFYYELMKMHITSYTWGQSLNLPPPSLKAPYYPSIYKEVGSCSLIITPIYLNIHAPIKKLSFILTSNCLTMMYNYLINIVCSLL